MPIWVGKNELQLSIYSGKEEGAFFKLQRSSWREVTRTLANLAARASPQTGLQGANLSDSFNDLSFRISADYSLCGEGLSDCCVKIDLTKSNGWFGPNFFNRV
jgi:hypothetical protein